MKSILSIMGCCMLSLIMVSSGQSEWIEVRSSSPSIIHCFSSLGSRFFAGTDGGVLISTDEGVTWLTITNGIPSTEVIGSMTVVGSVIFAGGESGVYRSVDNGEKWSLVTSGMTSVRTLVSKGSLVFAGAIEGVFRSSNSGASWVGVNVGLDLPWVNCFAVKGNTMFAGGDAYYGGLFRSTNDGGLWTNCYGGDLQTDVVSAAVVGRTIFVCNSWGGICRSTDDGDTWIYIEGTSFLTTVLGFGQYLFFTNGYNIGISLDAGTSGTSCSSGQFGRVSAIGSHTGFVFVATPGGAYGDDP